MTPPAGKDAEEKPYLSIREVLDLLVAEFPDVTVSKIRFLESRGLIHPERTPSGYRKFYDQDVERLRWILRQQRENFLPLKIIKGRLEQEAGSALADGEQSLFESEEIDEARSLVSAGVGPSLASANVKARHDRGVAETSIAATPPARSSGGADQPDAPELVVETLSPSPPLGANSPGSPPEHEPMKEPPGTNANESAQQRASRNGLGVGVHFSAEELATAASTELQLVAELEDYGLIVGREIGGVRCYDEQALLVAKTAASFRRFGIEARHLKSFKYAAEREAGLFSQVVSPLLRQRNPEARERAQSDLAELADLAQRLQQLFVIAELAKLTGG